jgi:hypothetical protein
MGMEPSNRHTARDGLLLFISCYQHTHSTTEQFCNRFRISFIYTSRNGSTFDNNRHHSIDKKQKKSSSPQCSVGDSKTHNRSSPNADPIHPSFHTQVAVNVEIGNTNEPVFEHRLATKHVKRFIDGRDLLITLPFCAPVS